MRVKRLCMDIRDERGVATAVVLVSMLFIVSVIALAIDGGMLLFQRRHIVNTADGAALAAAQAYANGATTGATCGTNDSPAIQQADSVATGNWSSAVRDSYTCPYVDKKGVTHPNTVKVVYHADVQALFMGAVGLGSTHPVKATAVAAWGTPGGAVNLMPFELNADLVQGSCGAPNPQPGTPCVFWYANNTGNSSQWGILNLCTLDAQAKGACNNVGWDVGPGASGCSSTGTAYDRTILQSGFPYALTLHQPPPTYVCVQSGLTSSFSQIQVCPTDPCTPKVFPVNDPSRAVLDKQGNPYKYAIAGFTAMVIRYVGRGNDPQTLIQCGTPPAWVGKNPSNAYCLKVQWEGPVEVPSGIDPNQQNFGVYAIALQG
jgi:hypothetical protein